DGGVHTLGFWISPHELLGKNASISGWVKAEKSSGAALATVFAIGDSGWVEKARSIEFRDTSDWQAVRLDFRQDDPVHSIYLFLGTEGGGKVWFDDFRLSVEGREKTSVEVAPDFSSEQRLWLKKNVTPFKSCRPAGQGETDDFSDLAFFKKAVGDAQIIALGEATHGTSEFFTLKHRLLQFAVRELGVRVFAIEANQLEVEKINRYVCGGEGTAEQIIRVMFSVWNTQEMLALIEWMRAWNLENPSRMVEFVGFDLQDPSLPMDSLSQFFGDWEPALRPLADSLQRGYRAAWRAQYYPQAPDSVRLAWKVNADRVLALVNARLAEWRGKANSPAAKKRVEWALQNTRVVSQAADIAFSQKVSGRDTFMAENIRWIQSMRSPGTRILVWAHDSHIARSDHPDQRFNYHSGDSMGKYLSRIFGNKYKAFGLFTAGGQYSATISFSNHKM
ncbi:MAG: erythromycin esterase family protein, partial [Bacteroidota bacterium]